MSRESRLKKSLVEINDNYDYIIIDCPPSLGLLTINALTAADSVMVPIQCEYYAMEGLGQLMNTIELVRKNLNPDLRIEGVLMTMYDARTNLSEQVIEEVEEYFSDLMFKTIIPRNVRLSEAPSFGRSILEYSSNSKGAEAYRKLAEEVVTSE
jgi:chromosome partitioning protein